MSTGFHDCRRKRSDNMSVQSLHFQLIDIAPPIAQFGYNLERLHFQLIVLLLPIARYRYNLEGFILTHVRLTTPSLMIGLRQWFSNCGARQSTSGGGAT